MLEAKIPAEVKDYGVDFTDYLASGQTIENANVTWTVPSGITKASQAVSGSTVLARFSGGTADENYTIVVTAITSAGETLVAAFQIRVRTPEVAFGIT